MKNVLDTTNEIGKVTPDSGIETYIKMMIEAWNESLKATASWWKKGKVTFIAVTKFLLTALADIILYLGESPMPSADKKATVINAIGRLYDGIVFAAMPVWLKPFAPLVRKIIIGQVIPAVIDFFVEKYNTGSWNKKDPQTIAKLFGKPTI